MSIGLYVDLLIWIVALIVLITVFIIWGLYRLFSYLRRRSDADEGTPSRRLSQVVIKKAIPLKQPTPVSIITPSNLTIGSRLDSETVASLNVKSANTSIHDIENASKALPDHHKQIHVKNKYIEYNEDSDSKSNDKILHYDLATKSLASYQSNKLVEMRSNQSRKSTGFEPTMRSVEPIINSSKGNNFLDILDQLDNLDELELENLKEKEKKRKKYEERTYTASSAGIEAESSDETSSQTFIGKEPDSRSEPGLLELSFIKASSNS